MNFNQNNQFNGPAAPGNGFPGYNDFGLQQQQYQHQQNRMVPYPYPYPQSHHIPTQTPYYSNGNSYPTHTTSTNFVGNNNNNFHHGSLKNYTPIPVNQNPFGINRLTGYGNTSITTANAGNYEYDEDFSEKLIAYARFNRNTDLMKEILSDVMVPDVRQIVSTSRLDILKAQVLELEKHTKKLEDEATMVGKESANRKRKFLESTAEYHEKYKKLCRKPVTTEMYNAMVNRSYDNLKQEDERQQWEQTLAWAQQTAASASNNLSSSETPAIDEILGLPQELENNPRIIPAPFVSESYKDLESCDKSSTSKTYKNEKGDNYLQMLLEGKWEIFENKRLQNTRNWLQF